MLAVSITGAVLFVAGVVFDGTKVIVFTVAVGASLRPLLGSPSADSPCEHPQESSRPLKKSR